MLLVAVSPWPIFSGAEAEEGARGRKTKGQALYAVLTLEQVQAAFEKRKKEAEVLRTTGLLLDLRSNS